MFPDLPMEAGLFMLPDLPVEAGLHVHAPRNSGGGSPVMFPDLPTEAGLLCSQMSRLTKPNNISYYFPFYFLYSTMFYLQIHV